MDVAGSTNLMPVFGEEWVMVDSSEKNDMSVFYFSEDRKEAIIDNRLSYSSLKKYMAEAVIEPEKTYRVSAAFEEWDTKGKNIVYAMITLKKPDGSTSRRCYLENVSPGEISYVFQSGEEVVVRLELGIKSFGKVVWHQPKLQECEPIKPRKAKLASVYLRYNPSPIPYMDNLKRIEESFDKAAIGGVDLVAYAECINTNTTAEQKRYETLDGEFCRLMKRKAKEHSCYAFFSFHELDEHGCKRNTAVLIGRNGELVGTCRKSHLTISEYDAGLVPGDSYPVFDTDFGRVGMLVCWDSYFPEPARAMVLQGAEILLISTAGNPTHRHFARAMENGVYVVVSCRSGVVRPDERVKPTKIISPEGMVIDECNTEGEAAKAEIDLNHHQRCYWLSVGACDGYSHNIYMHEYREDIYDEIITERNLF